MATNNHPLILRIRRARAAITTAELELIAARDSGNAREVGRLVQELGNRRAYLDELQGAARLMPRQ